MKFAVLQFFSWPERRVDLATVYARALERIEIMDRTGYDAVWLAEHHFSSFSVCPSVHMVGMLAAARTRRLRIGTGVSLAPFYHPLRLAEEVALLDLLSGGRVNWGAGRGFARVEFEAFGVPPEESTARFRETVEIVLKAWTDERLTFTGEHFRFDGIEVLPKPAQRPHPPVWMAASSRGRDRMGRRPRLLDPDGPAFLGRRDRAQAPALCRAPGGRRFFRGRPRHSGGPAGGARPERGRGGGGGAQRRPMDRQFLSRRPAPPGDAVEFHPRGRRPGPRYLDEVILHGTPEAVIDQILRLRDEIGLDYLLCAPLSHETFVLLTEQVLPRLA